MAGDRVYSKFYGLGVVVKNEDRRPIGRIVVDFGESTGTMTFDEEGHMLSRPENHEYYRVHRLTEMQAHVMRVLQYRIDGHETYSPGQLVHDWANLHKRKVHVASRDRFGATAAAYKCLYSLEKMGLIRRVDTGCEHDYFYELVKPNK